MILLKETPIKILISVFTSVLELLLSKAGKKSFWILGLGLGILVGCRNVMLEVKDMKTQVLLVYNTEQKMTQENLEENLGVFIKIDKERLGDLYKIQVAHEREGIAFEMTASDWQIYADTKDLWVGHARMNFFLGKGILPRGEWQVEVLLGNGEKRSRGFFLVDFQEEKEKVKLFQASNELSCECFQENQKIGIWGYSTNGTLVFERTLAAQEGKIGLEDILPESERLLVKEIYVYFDLLEDDLGVVYGPLSNEKK